MLRVYLMGYEPPGVNMDAVGDKWIEDRIHECDMCFTVTDGHVPQLGEVFESVWDMSGPTPKPVPKRLYRVVGREHYGKVLVVEDVTGS